MHELHIFEPPQKASLSRRSFLAAGVASALVVGAAAVAEAAYADDNYNELMFKLDLRDELVEQHVDAITAFEAIDGRDDRPNKVPHVQVYALFGQKHTTRYYPHCGHYVLRIDDQGINLHSFFEEQIEWAVSRATLKPEWADWPVVKARDYHRATSAILKQLNAREDWEVKTGHRAAEDEVERICDELCEVERQIYALPVKSFRELRLKLALLDDPKWFLDDDHMRLLLLSIVDFAASDGRPDRRYDQGAEAGAV